MKKIFYLFFIIFLLSSCSKKKEVIVLTEQDMYNNALKNLDKKMYKTAGDEFKKIEEQFIFTPIATKSIIMAIYSYYKAGEYDDALLLIEYYKKINFGIEYTNYILYMEILIKYKKVSKNWKDLNLMADILNDINVFAMYDTKYRKDILEKKQKIIDKIALNELKIFEFYLNNNNLIGALNHLNNVLDYPENKYTPEALYKIIVLYKYINYKEGVEKYKNLLEKNYKKTKWYKNATQL